MRWTCLSALLFVLWLFAGPRADAQPKREVRAVWITTVYNIDWPKTTMPELQREHMREILDSLKKANINTIMFQVRARGDLTYPSEIEPWAKAMTQTLGQSPGYDPLQFVINEAHARGMEVHAWMVTHKVYNGSNPPPSTTPEHVVNAHPQWCTLYEGSSDSWWLDPGIPQVRDYLTSIVMEMLEMYPLDAVHFDYIRYPGSDFDDDETYETYGNGMDKADWRRQNINEFVYQVYDSVQAYHPDVKVGSTPIGIYQNVEGATGWQGYYDVYQDSRAWVEAGKHDYLAPQIYWDTQGRFMPLLKDWLANDYGKHIYTGLGAYRIAEKKASVKQDFYNNKELYLSRMHSPKTRGWPSDEIIRQVDSCRKYGAEGQVYFSSSYITKNIKDLMDKLEARVYSLPSHINPMLWKDQLKPNKPQNLTVEAVTPLEYQLSWEAPAEAEDGDQAGYYVVYSGHSPNIDTSNMQRVVGFQVIDTAFTLQLDTIPSEPYYFTVSAFDDFYNESDTSRVVTVENNSGIALQTPLLAGKATTRMPWFSWNDEENAREYILQISAQPDFSQIMLQDTVNSPWYYGPKLDPDTRYFWRVKSGQVNEWSFVHYFNTEREFLHEQASWNRLAGNLPEWIDTAQATETAIAAAEGQLFVVDSTEGIRQVDAATGQATGWVNTSGIVPEHIGDVAAAPEGTLFAVTHSADAGQQAVVFYKWSETTSAPEELTRIETSGYAAGSDIALSEGNNPSAAFVPAENHAKIFIIDLIPAKQASVGQLSLDTSVAPGANASMAWISANEFVLTGDAYTYPAVFDASGNHLGIFTHETFKQVADLATANFDGFTLLAGARTRAETTFLGHQIAAAVVNNPQQPSGWWSYSTSFTLGAHPSAVADLGLYSDTSGVPHLALFSATNGGGVFTPAQHAPVLTNMTMEGTPEPGYVLQPQFSYTDPEDDPKDTVYYSWFIADDEQGTNAVAIDTADSAAFRVRLQDEGKYIFAKLQPQAKTGFRGYKTQQVAVGPVQESSAKKPVAENVHISGDPEVMNRLIGYYDYSDPNGEPEGDSQYQWYRADDKDGTNLTAIQGGIGRSHLLRDEDLGKYIAFEVTPVSETSMVPQYKQGEPVMSDFKGPVYPTGIEQAENKALAVYPNPARKTLFVRSGNISCTDILITGIRGNVLKHKTISPEELVVLHINMLKNGVYFVHILDKKSYIMTVKFIKL